MKKSVNKIVLSTLTATFLVGCGGGSDIGSSLDSLSGKVIDGYIEGSTVCLDLNLDGACSEDEPSSITDSNGSYSLTITTDVRNHSNFNIAPIIASGGIDTDTGEDFEGKLETIPSENGGNLTPLTTVISKMAKAEVTSGLTKEEVKAKIAEKKETLKKVLALPDDVDLEDDFISGENKDLNKAALQIQKTVELITKAVDNGSTATEKIQEKVIELIASKASSIDTSGTTGVNTLVNEVTTEAEKNTSEIFTLTGKVLTTEATTTIKTISNNIDVAFEKMDENKNENETFEDIVQKVVYTVETEIKKVEDEISKDGYTDASTAFTGNEEVFTKSLDTIRIEAIQVRLKEIGLSDSDIPSSLTNITTLDELATSLSEITSIKIEYNNFFDVDFVNLNEEYKFIKEAIDLYLIEKIKFKLVTVYEDKAFSIDLNKYFEDVEGVVLSLGSSLTGMTLTDGVLSGTLTNDFVGLQSLNLNVNDTVKTLFIDVKNINDAPTLSSEIADQSIAEDNTTLSVDIKSHFTDDDANDTLTYSATLEDGTALPSWLTFTDGVFSGIPTNENVGIYAIKVTASDGKASVSDTFTLTVSNTNDAPTLKTSIGAKAAEQTVPFLLDITSNFEDLDVSDTLTYSATLIDDSALPSWLTFTNGVFSGTPGNSDITITPWSIKVTATDGTASVSDTFTLDVADKNDVPTVVTSVSMPEILEDESKNIDLTQFFNDVDTNDVLTITATLEDGSALPSWITLSNNNLTVNATNDNVGEIKITLVAKDKFEAEATATYTLKVTNVNDAPTGSSISNQNISLDDVSSYSLDVTTFFNDVDANDTLTYDVTFASGELLPSWLSFTSNILSVNGSLDSSYAGDYEMKVTATDKSGEKAVINFTLSVQKDKFTQALDIIDSIDPELEDIDTKLGEAKAILDNLSSSEAKVVGILISIAEIANNQAISDLIFISNETEAYSGTNLNALVRNSVMDFVNVDDLIKNEATSNLSSTATATIHEIATKLKSLSDELSNYFKTNTDSYTYNGETMTYDDANALRATALAVAFKLENLSAYQWGVDSDLATQELNGNEFIKLDVDPASVLNSGNFFKLVDGSKVETAKTYLVEALDMASKIPVGYDNGSMTQDDSDLIGDLKAAFAGNGQYTITDFDETDEVKSVTIDLNKMFSSTTALSINDLGSSWTNSCSGDNGTLYAGVDNSVATSYGYAICEYSTNYGMWTEDAELDPEVLPTSTTSKIDDIVLNITLRQDSKVLMGQDLIDYLIDDEEEPVNNSIVLNDIIGQKLAISDTETYYFTKEGLVLGDSGEDYTETASVTEQSDGTIKVLFDDGAYDILVKTDTGYTVTYYLADNSNDGSDNITTDFVSFSETELDSVLADVAPTSLTRMTAVDPYISMANFCADLNSNNSCDTDEPISTYSSENGEFMFNTLIAEGTPILINEKGTHLGEEFDGDIKAYAGDGTVISPLTTMEVNGFTQTQVINLLENYGIGITNFNLDPFKPFAENNVQSYDYADLQATIAVHTFLKMTDYGLTPSVAFDQYGDLAEPYASAMNLATLLIKSTINETLVSNYSSAEPKYIIYTAVAIANYLVDKVATMEQSESGTGFSYLSSYLGDSTKVSAHIGLLANAYMNDSSKFYELNSDGTTAVEVGTEGSLTSFEMDGYTFTKVESDERYKVEGNSLSFDDTTSTATLISQKVIGEDSRTGVKTKFDKPKQMLKAKVMLGDTSDSTQRLELTGYMYDKNSLSGIFAALSVRNNQITYSLEKNIYSDADTIASSTVIEDVTTLLSDTFSNKKLALILSYNQSNGIINFSVYDENGTELKSVPVTIPEYNTMNLGFDSSEIRVRTRNATESTPETTTGYFAGYETKDLAYLTTAPISSGSTVLFSSLNKTFEWLDIAKFNSSTLDMTMYEDNGSGFVEGNKESMDISYSSDNLSINLLDNGSTAVICTNSNTRKINNVNGVVYSDLYRSKNTCENQVTINEQDEWDWDWNKDNTYTNDIDGLVDVFNNGAYFQHAGKYFMLKNDYQIYVAVQNGYWDNGDIRVDATTELAGQWSNDTDSINLSMYTDYKFSAEISLNSNNQIVFSYVDLAGYTESDYMWTGSDAPNLFQNITGINPESTPIDLSSVSIFTQELLSSITFYDVYKNYENGAWDENFSSLTMKFDSGTIKIAEGISENWVHTYNSFEILENGMLKYTDDFNMNNDTNFQPVDRYIKINSSTQDRLFVCYGEGYDTISACDENTDNNEYLFVDSIKAQTFMNNN